MPDLAESKVTVSDDRGDDVRRLRFSAAVLAGTLLLSGSALAAGPYPPPSKGTGHVEPSRIRVGECAVFSGDGFAPLTTVAVSDNGASRGTATSNLDGEFSKQLCYGSNAKRGRHNLAGSGAGSDGSALTVYAVLIVEGVQQSASNPGTAPGGAAGSAAGGTTGDSAVPSIITGGTTGAVEAPVPVDGGSEPTASPAAENSGTRLLLLGLTGLGLAFLASLLLLLIARRRRRDDDAPYDAVPLPA